MCCKRDVTPTRMRRLEYMFTCAQFGITIGINHPSCSEWNFFPNKPFRIKIWFCLTCLYDAFLCWSGIYSEYLYPCKGQRSLSPILTTRRSTSFIALFLFSVCENTFEQQAELSFCCSHSRTQEIFYWWRNKIEFVVEHQSVLSENISMILDPQSQSSSSSSTLR